MAASDTISAFIGHINAMQLDQALALLAPDVVYHNIPMTPVIGPAAVRAAFDQIPYEAMQWFVHCSAESEGHVLNERTDRFRLKDGRWVELRVMGSFEVQDGRITAWRDYFDLGQWMAQLAPQPAVQDSGQEGPA
jgi:limonene-1,2-epoxide hydrolase